MEQATTTMGETLVGARAIALFLFGNGDHRRKVYYLVERNNLPVFRIGSVICARTAVLLHWIQRQESVCLLRSSAEAI